MQASDLMNPGSTPQSSPGAAGTLTLAGATNSGQQVPGCSAIGAPDGRIYLPHRLHHQPAHHLLPLPQRGLELLQSPGQVSPRSWQSKSPLQVTSLCVGLPAGW